MVSNRSAVARSPIFFGSNLEGRGRWVRGRVKFGGEATNKLAVNCLTRLVNSRRTKGTFIINPLEMLSQNCVRKLPLFRLNN